MSDTSTPKKEMTEYVKVLLASNEIPRWWGHLAHVCSWILVQGFVIFPSISTAYNTTTSKLGSPPVTSGESVKNIIKGEIFYIIRHVPLIWIAWGAVLIGGFGKLYCLLRWRRNYVWGLKEVIKPGVFESSTGLMSTLASLWALDGHMPTATKISLFVTSGSTGIFVFLWVIYQHVLLRQAKKKHVDEAGYHGTGQFGEGRLIVPGNGSPGETVPAPPAAARLFYFSAEALYNEFSDQTPSSQESSNRNV